ncbi:MAG: glutamine-hydrolyzing carbamoyl-phosphate synthase small subunit [Gammaproteobacteria bacterium]
MSTVGLLALENGTVFHGTAIGAPGHAVGEIVFNTAMTGYQEILTDPSYAEQIVTLTYPHIGNVGTNPLDHESDKVWAKGLVIRDLSLTQSNWRSTQNLGSYLQAHNIVAIADIDTRQLTHILREQGAQGACIMTGTDEVEALKLAKAFPGLTGMDLASIVGTQKPYQWDTARWSHPEPKLAANAPHVVALDFGIKHNILRCLVSHGCRVTVIPGNSSKEDIYAHKPDGVFLSNGPGDPAACGQAIETIQQLLQDNIPIFGICLGHQLIALACGGSTFKMKVGHHGANHPVVDVHSRQVFISSQNHGFAVDEATLPPFLKVTHRSLFDNTIQGIKHSEKPVFAFQGHPEASPGPHDVVPLFAEFMQIMRGNKHA